MWVSSSDKCVTTPNCIHYKPYHICVHMCNKIAMSVLLATHDSGFYLSTAGTRVNQTIRSLLPTSCVLSLKIHWVKCISILRVHSYKLRLSFCVVFCVVRAMRECNLVIILSKSLTKSDLWQKLLFLTGPTCFLV
jgi:hypothetical protein